MKMRLNIGRGVILGIMSVFVLSAPTTYAGKKQYVFWKHEAVYEQQVACHRHTTETSLHCEVRQKKKVFCQTSTTTDGCVEGELKDFDPPKANVERDCTVSRWNISLNVQFQGQSSPLTGGCNISNTNSSCKEPVNPNCPTDN